MRHNPKFQVKQLVYYSGDGEPVLYEVHSITLTEAGVYYTLFPVHHSDRMTMVAEKHVFATIGDYRDFWIANINWQYDNMVRLAEEQRRNSLKKIGVEDESEV